MYKPEDFNIGSAPKEMVQYVLDNVEDFDARYYLAIKEIGRSRCSLQRANESLFDEIKGAMVEWAMYESNLTDEEFEELDAEEIFG